MPVGLVRKSAPPLAAVRELTRSLTPRRYGAASFRQNEKEKIVSDFKAVSNYATLAGFRVMVIANRFACDNRIARLAHDNLIHHLDMRIAETRRFITLENIYDTATDECVDCH